MFPKPNCGSSQPITPLQRPALERRQQKSISTSYKNLMINHSIQIFQSVWPTQSTSEDLEKAVR